ncbi:hypothetical protein BV25DRAFT_1345422 [Artomyces pyxidatus]|uniref:Uncharacterized protein n=1 Tax=Artomyces pyxidatus TaxID=48021 RepID=A0ACB8SN02_9AGAM|nr:hypothetical protein BV25DRAFT_1345422 [Artomyces pyxidatus]
MCLRVRVISVRFLYTPHAHVLRSFGLLHRIPPVQENREPGSLPPELHDASNEFEEQELFVPADTSGSDFELHDDEHHHHHHQQHHDYPVEYGSPDASQDYSYSYSNRGAAYQQGHPAAATSIPEEREEYDDDSRSHSPASSHSHSHSHSSHDHDHDHGHNHHHDHHHDDHHHHSEDSETSYHRTPTPESSRALGGVYSNGVPYNGVRSRTSIPENFGNGRSSFRAAGQRQAGPDEDEAEGDSDHELSSEHDGSLTSVE